MGDNKSVRDADNASFVGAADELSDTSFSPKVTLLAGDSTPTPISPATSGRQDTANTSIGATNETAPATDIAASGLNGRLQRIAQRITSLIALVPAVLTGSGNFKTALLEALPAGTNLIGKVGIDQTTPGTTNLVQLPADKATYSAGFSTITLAAAATDVCVLTGSASKTIKVLRVELAGYATANTSAQVALLKRSTADTGGTSANATNVPHDSNSAAATGVLNRYTANPTVGTLIGVVRAAILSFTTAATSSIAARPIVWDFTSRDGEPVVLRGTAQQLCVGLEGNTVGGGILSCTFEWTEE